MRSHEREDARRNKKNVRHEKTRDRESAHLSTTAHQALDALPNPGNLTDGVGSHGGGKIGFLVPGKQITGECHCHYQTEKGASGEPKKFAPSLVRSVDVSL